jgi:hypothetical protein
MHQNNAFECIRCFGEKLMLVRETWLKSGQNKPQEVIAGGSFF